MSPSNETKPRPKKKAEPIGLRFAIDKNGTYLFAPASSSDQERLRAKRMNHGDLVFVDFRKPRNVGFHRLAHALGKMVVENVEDFDHLTPHEALKRLQVESGAGCEILHVEMSTIWKDISEWIAINLGASFATVLKESLKAMGVKSRMVAIRVPRSLSFDSMDQETFHEVLRAICKYVAKRYWPSMTPEQIQEMAEAAGKELLE